jgi:2-dehydro-3-deoxygluconokinase
VRDSFNGAFLARFTVLGGSVAAAHHAARVDSIVIGHHGALIEPTALSVLPGFNPPA